MKIIQVPTYVVYGGMSLHVLDLSAGLIERGHEVSVLSMCPGPLEPEFKAAGIPFSVVPRLQQRAGYNPATLSSGIRHIRKVIREEKPDVVHTHGPRAHFLAGIAAKSAGRHCLVATAHGSWRQFMLGQTAGPGAVRRRLKKSVYSGIDRMTARYADRMIAVSQATEEDLVAGLGIAADRVSVVHNGIPEQSVGASDIAAVRREFGIGERELMAVCVGRLAWHKGTGYLAAALDIALSESPGAKVLLVGEGPMEAELKSEAGDRWAGRVIVTGRRTDAIKIIAAADLLVMASLSEGLPLTLLEAAMTGTPMVATDVGGVREVVREGETGLLCRAADADALAAAIGKMFLDQEGRRRMGEAARVLWEQEYRIGTMVNRIEDLYRETCGRGQN